MKVETFLRIFIERIRKRGYPKPGGMVYAILDEINYVTDGAFYASIEKLPEDWEFPE